MKPLVPGIALASLLVLPPSRDARADRILRAELVVKAPVAEV